MKVDLFIHNGCIVTEGGTFVGGVAVNEGKISGLVKRGEAIDATKIIDLEGRILLPGAIDAHAHFSEVGRDLEGYTRGTKAAAAGGITTALDMPLNDLPPTIDREKLINKREMVKDKAVIDYAHWGGLVDNNLSALGELHEEGVIGYKAFYSEAIDYPKVNDYILFAGLKKMRSLGNVVGLHAENLYVTNGLAEELKEEGRKDFRAWHESRPPETELEAINRAIFWAKASGGNLHIVHVSTSIGLHAISQAKLDGVRVTAETCAHYLCFDEDDLLTRGVIAKAAPPLRPRSEVEKMWGCVFNGEVDIITSDHSPFPLPDEKDNVWTGGGIIGIQSLLSAMISEGVNKRGLSWSNLTRMLSTNPARIFGLYPRKGSIMLNSDADFAIVDPESEWTLTEDMLYSKYKHSAYVGCTFKGKIDQTIVRGETVYKDGEITVDPGYGQLICRESAYSVLP